MPITKESLIQFKERKLQAKKDFELKKESAKQEIDRKVKEYHFELMRGFDSVIKEGERLDAEINYLDFLIQEEEKSMNPGEVI